MDGAWPDAPAQQPASIDFLFNRAGVARGRVRTLGRLRPVLRVFSCPSARVRVEGMRRSSPRPICAGCARVFGRAPEPQGRPSVEFEVSDIEDLVPATLGRDHAVCMDRHDLETQGRLRLVVALPRLRSVAMPYHPASVTALETHRTTITLAARAVIACSTSARATPVRRRSVGGRGGTRSR